MNRAICVSSALALLALGCGGDPPEEPGPQDPPVLGERSLPTLGGPGEEEFDEPPPPEDTYDPDDQGPDPDAFVECCTVRFALIPEVADDDVREVTLRGAFPPLDAPAGVALAEGDPGVWSAEACVQPDQLGPYHYDVGAVVPLRDDLFIHQAFNPHAPQSEVAGQIVNFLLIDGGCDDPSIAAHARTSE